jgi:hypothetical protein
MRRRDFVKGVVGSAVPWPLSACALQAAVPINEGTSGSVSSAGVFHSSGKLVRTLWSAQTKHPAVNNPASAWDGTSDDGSVAPSGTYEIKVLSNNVSYTWEGVVGNTSPDHYANLTYLNPSAPVFDMEITDAGEIYYTTAYQEKWTSAHWTTQADPQVATWVKYSDGQDLTGNCHSVCTDGLFAYIAMYPNGPPQSYLYGVSCSTKRVTAFPVENQYHQIGVDNGASGDPYITGLAVQKSGSFLFIAKPIINTITVLNKTTGAIAGNDTNFPLPFQLATSPTTGDLWLGYYSTNNGKTFTKIAKLSVDGSGNLSATGVEITGLQNVLALAVSPDGATLLVTDGGTSQQVKAFNTSDGSVKTEWGNSGTLGDAGGYANGPAVTDSKFMFVSNLGLNGVGPQSYIAYAPDGSFWLGDTGNVRNLHFSAGNSPSILERFSFIPSFYSCEVCRGDPTRVFSNWLEWQIDYSKPLALGNGSWTLKNNWSFGTTPDTGDPFGILGFVGVYSNGRTYAGIQNKDTGYRDIYELTATGLRKTGKSVYVACYMDGNFNLYYADGGAGNVGHIYRNSFARFDNSNNPTWVRDPTQIPRDVMLTTEMLPPLFTGLISFNPFEPTANGVIPTFQRSSLGLPGALYNHFGGIDATTGRVKFSTHPANQNPYFGGPGLGFMLYPEAPYFLSGVGPIGVVGDNGGGAFIYKPGDPDIFTSYRGEMFGGGQTNVWSHWHDSGLLVNRFGPVMPYYAAPCLQAQLIVNHQIVVGQNNYFKGLPGAAGNARTGGIAAVGGKYYIYHADEWFHGGLHRWRVENLESIALSSVTVHWDANNYNPTPDPHDLLAGLPFGKLNIADGTAGWHRSPTSDVSDWRHPPHFSTATNIIKCNPHDSPDLMVSSSRYNSNAFLYKDLLRSGSGNWVLDATVFFSGASYYHSSGDYFLLNLEILDTAGKVIVFMTNAQDDYHTPTGTVLWVNFQAITTPPGGLYDWGNYSGNLRDLTVNADVSAGTMKVTYGDYSITVGVYEAGADIKAPTRFRINYTTVGGNAGNNASLDITKLRFTG